MNSSRKTTILSSKEFNTQNSATPKKITTPPVSHFSNRKVCNENSGAGVSYAELQIILENVHQVKKKANEQITTLEKINFKLSEDLRIANQHVQKCENYEELLNEQRTTMESKHEIQLSLLREEVKSEQENCARHSQTILELKREITQKQSEIESLQEEINKYKKSVEVSKNKYDLITKALQVNEYSNELDLIRDEYGGIPKLFEALIESKTARKHQELTIEELKSSNAEFKKHISQNDKIIETVTQENKYLLSMVTGMGKEKESLLASMAEIEEEKSKVLKQKESALNEIEDSIEGIRKTNDERVREKELMICKLKERTGELEKQLMECEERERINHQEAEFKSMVDEVCDEYSDYENVIKRTQYLEKYKSEYYFNIEKIQYLCKILDS